MLVTTRLSDHKQAIIILSCFLFFVKNKKNIPIFILKSSFKPITHNELGYTTLSVAEPRRGVSVGAPSCVARSVTEDNVPLGRARAKVPSVACQPKLCGVAINSDQRKFPNEENLN